MRIDERILETYPELFGTKTIAGRRIDVEETLAALTLELSPEIDQALSKRREILQSSAPVREKYSWPNWDEVFADPISSRYWSFHEIVQGLIDNFLGKKSAVSWRLNDEVPVPEDAHPLKNPGLELTGPWHPIDMAFNALNSAAPMNMPDFEDASPAHFRPAGSPPSHPLGVLAALQNAKEIFEGSWDSRSYEVVKKNSVRTYAINAPHSRWPKRFVRPPSIHVRYEDFLVEGKPAPALVIVAVLWTLNNYASLKHLGTGVYFYIPKLQTPQEAMVVETLFVRLEESLGIPVGTIKIKMLYEEGNGGRFLPAIIWTLRRRLLGTNVGRWDYLGSLIEMWKDDPHAAFPDPQTIGMAAPNMIAYQRFNALMMLMAGMKEGELTQGAPIGGMAAVMIYQPNDIYGRSRYNPLALRAMKIDKLRERLLGLMFVPEGESSTDNFTLENILTGETKGRIYDAYRQSWVASPEPAYVAAGNVPLQAPLAELQAMLDAPVKTVDVDGKQVPTVESGLVEAERQLLRSRGLLDEKGKITPRLIALESIDTPEKLLNGALWESIYAVPSGDITIEHIQHAFYMAANYGFQILNGNFAAAIDDYELSLRFMNDLATYRIDMSWLWSLLHHEISITKDGHLKHAKLTENGVVPAEDGEAVPAGTRVTAELFEKVWSYHNEWTTAFFRELDRLGDPGRFDRAKAGVIMELMKRQLLSPRYIQHSARLLFVIGSAGGKERADILEAAFDLSRKEIVRRVKVGTMTQETLAAFDYVHDFVGGGEGQTFHES